MNAKTLTAVALLMAALPAASFAQSAPARPAPPTLDFAAADTDGSGGISAEEWTAYSATLHSEMRAQRIAERADALIAAGDANGDTALDRDELIAAMTAQADERREARGERRGPMGGMMRGMMGGTTARMATAAAAGAVTAGARKCAVTCTARAAVNAAATVARGRWAAIVPATASPGSTPMATARSTPRNWPMRRR
ncbi:hypothetical protein MASR1M49_41860 [Pararhodobacter aggregans]